MVLPTLTPRPTTPPPAPLISASPLRHSVDTPSTASPAQTPFVPSLSFFSLHPSYDVINDVTLYDVTRLIPLHCLQLLSKFLLWSEVVPFVAKQLQVRSPLLSPIYSLYFHNYYIVIFFGFPPRNPPGHVSTPSDLHRFLRVTYLPLLQTISDLILPSLS